MKYNPLMKLFFVATGAVLTASSSFAATYSLRTCAGSVTIGGASVWMWGYDLAGPAACSPKIPGPRLTVNPGDTTLTITLTNNLPVPTSIVIPGLTVGAGQAAPVKFTDPQGRQRARSFTIEAGPNGGSATYTWTGVRPGTYIYHSGSHPALQVQMGLYGAVTAGYQEYTNEALLVFSEIDPALHADVAGGKYVTRGVDSYKPAYFLINGQPHPQAQPVMTGTAAANQPLLIRFVNAGLKARAPMLLPHLPAADGTSRGAYMSLIAEDGFPYPFRKNQYSVNLPPLKTVDAVWTPTANGQYPLFDRALGLTTNGSLGGGMLAYLDVGGSTPLLAADDSYTVIQGRPLTIPAPGVLANDQGPDPKTAAVLASTTGGALSLNGDGSFTYTPNPAFTGADQFTYNFAANGATSNTATARISVTPNSAPVAVNDSASTQPNTAVTINVLANDTDANGDQLVIDPASLTPPTAGTVSLTPDGKAVIYTAGPAAGTATFSYKAKDPSGALSGAATVTVTVATAPNNAPVAVDDAAETRRNTAVTINVVANDYDPDGSVVPGTVAIADQPSRGGAVTNNGNGTVTYTPRRNFRGTDTFTYTVRDNQGAVSNKATVRVNVR